MNITNAIKKQKAIELMNKLNIYKPYIKGFEKDNHVCFFEGFGGFWAYQEPELMAKIKEFEEKHNVLVYAVTHEYTEFGECYDFLFISDYEEEWGEMLYTTRQNVLRLRLCLEQNRRLLLGVWHDRHLLVRRWN